MRLIDADRFAEISKHHIPEVLEDTFDEGYIACLKVVDLTPTVKAIPIEWIQKEIIKLVIGKDRKFSSQDTAIVYTIIDRWRNENNGK